LEQKICLSFEASVAGGGGGGGWRAEDKPSVMEKSKGRGRKREFKIGVSGGEGFEKGMRVKVCGYSYALSFIKGGRKEGL